MAAEARSQTRSRDGDALLHAGPVVGHGHGCRHGGGRGRGRGRLGSRRSRGERRRRSKHPAARAPRAWFYNGIMGFSITMVIHL